MGMVVNNPTEECLGDVVRCEYAARDRNSSCKSGSAASNAVVQCIGGGVEQEGEIWSRCWRDRQTEKFADAGFFQAFAASSPAPCIWS